MDITFQLAIDLILLVFWAAVLAFVPTMFYLLIKNPPISRIERINSEWIYILSQDDDLKKAQASRTKVVLFIYDACFAFLMIVYFINWQNRHPGFWPFDILSSLSVIFFWFSVLSYMPFVFYFAIKDPWKKQEDGPCLTGLFIGYGVSILAFAIAFALSWMKRQGVPIGIIEVGAPLAYVLSSSLIVAYLPILAYILMKTGKVFRTRVIHGNIVFVIYSVSFLTSAVVYVAAWVATRQAGSLHPF